MITLELRLMANGREVSIEDAATIVAEQVARRMGREIRQQLETLRQADQRDSAIPSAAPVSEPKAVSVPQAAKLLGVSVGAVRKFIREKRLHAIHIGGRVLVSMEVVREALQKGIPERRAS